MSRLMDSVEENYRTQRMDEIKEIQTQQIIEHDDLDDFDFRKCGELLKELQVSYNRYFNFDVNHHNKDEHEELERKWFLHYMKVQKYIRDTLGLNNW